MRFGLACGYLGATVALWPASAATAQTRLNQADPSILERALPRPVEAKPETEPKVIPGPSVRPAQPVANVPRVAAAIVVDGAPEVPRSVFGAAVVPYIGRDLSRDDLAAVARAVADAARHAGFPFANAWVPQQPLADGILHVRLDAGTISAVRVIGATNPLADRILTRALVTGQPVRRGTVERAILLVGDIPGVTVKNTQFIRQDGFGILLVTIATDRVTAYAQVDNRGSREVGPIRSTVLASVRGVLQSGDELGLLSSQTPFEPSEFIFVRGRYSAPVGLNGSVLSVAASYGRAHPGAALSPLRVIGESVDAAVRLSTPLVRSRTRSVWANVELRGLRSDQTLLGGAFRNDRLATLTGSVNGSTVAGHGVLNAGLAMAVGLPIAGVSHEGDPRLSRSDGDARFVTWGYTVDWAMPLARHFSLILSSEGQLASRPLLATAEIGAGGPGFGRAYDYAERTGDDGILGAGEVRADAGAVLPGIIDRLQFYGSLDGGYVTNLRAGRGGGGLLSTATGDAAWAWETGRHAGTGVSADRRSVRYR